MNISLIKVGGSCLDKSISDVVDQILEKKNEKTIIVHGYSAMHKLIMKKNGVERKQFISASKTPSHFTDEPVLCTSILTANIQNNLFVKEFLNRGELGVCGIMGYRGLLIGKRKKKIRYYENDTLKLFKDDYSGRMTGVNKEILDNILFNNQIIIISPILLDPEIGPVVCDADSVASNIAVQLNIENYTIMSNINGFYRNDEILTDINNDEIPELLKFADGGMVKKLKYINYALKSGVEQIILQNGSKQLNLDSTGKTVFHAN